MLKTAGIIQRVIGVRSFTSSLQLGKHILTAMNKNHPVVCLESTIITHGMPYPQNLNTALRVQDIIKEQGAVPATVGIVNGKIKVGLSDEEIAHLAEHNKNVLKVSRRDLPFVISKGLNGGTTVAATMIIAQMAGIPIFVTGGIGGVHRGGETSWDVSADLMELGRTPVAVISSGVKSILDIGRTLEVLETQGVGVATFGDSLDFPAFYTRRSKFKSPYQLTSIKEAVSFVKSHQDLQLKSGLLIAVPVPEEFALPEAEIEEAISSAVALADEQGIVGPKVTPFILKHVAAVSDGRALAANIALIENNARVGGQIAVGLRKYAKPSGNKYAGSFSVSRSVSANSKLIDECAGAVKSSVSDSEITGSSAFACQVAVVGASIVDLLVQVSSAEFKSQPNPSFIKHKRDADPLSPWSHFLIAADGKSAQCKTCKSILKTLGGSTKGLHVHLEAKHKLNLKKQDGGSAAPATASPSTSSKRQKISDYMLPALDDGSIEAVLARMTALDGMPFRIFVTSKDLRNLFLAKGFSNLPKSEPTIRSKVMSYSLVVRSKIKAELTHHKAMGQRFSLTFDEWTSSGNKRFMNVNIHTGEKSWSLGLVRIKVSLTAENCLILLESRLDLFGISLKKDVVAIVTDGPNVMLKVGRLVEAEHQVCFAHGVHLAVLDVLYGRKSTETTPPALADSNESSEDEDDGDGTDGQFIIDDTVQEPSMTKLTTFRNIKEVICKVRKVVKYFKKSPLKVDTILEAYVIAEHGAPLSLLLDCKTRWNSLFTMLERFIKLKSSIQKALIDLKHPFKLEESDFDVIAEVVEVLLPVKLTVEAFCRSDANLFTADVALIFLFKKLRKLNTAFATAMTESLVERVTERRRNDLSGVLAYLQNPAANEPEADEVGQKVVALFAQPTKATIRKVIMSLVKRVGLSNTEDDPVPHMVGKDPQAIPKPNPVPVSNKVTMKNELEEAIKQSLLPMKEDYSCDLLKTIKKEMNIYDGGQQPRGTNLQKAFIWLKTIPPTSIEPERAFSAAAYIGTKIRSRLNDETLDVLLFLRINLRQNV